MKRVPPAAGLKLLRFLLIILSGVLLLPLPGQAELVKVRLKNGKTMEALSRQVIVRYRDDRGSRPGARVARRFGASVKRSLDKINVQILSVPSGDTIESFIAKLQADPDVVYAEPNGIVRALFTPNDPQFSDQNYFSSSRLAMESAWDITQGNAGVIVAVLDTGIDDDHQDLINKLNPNGARIEIDFDGDGICNPALDPNPAGAGPDQCAGADYDDDNSFNEDGAAGANIFHGTHVAGLIGAETNNGLNIAGVAPNVQLMGVKVLNSWGAGSYGAVAEGILHAVNNGAHVINMSLGGGDPQNSESQAVRDAINQAIAANIVVVAAAGNDAGPVNFPASISEVIAVGATNDNQTLANFSCTGPEIDLVAPGVTIRALTAVPINGDNNTLSGTSFSAPLVAGVAALIKSLNVNFTSAEVTQFLNFTARDLGASEFDSTFGFGELNAAAAVRAANGDTDLTQPKTYPFPNPYRPTQGSVRFVPPVSLGTDNPEIKIYTIAGELVKTLNNTLVWDGRNDDGNLIASGLYFYFMKTTNGDVIGKLTVIK